MKILIICSKKFYSKIEEVKKNLEKKNIEVFLPNCYDDPTAEQKAWDLGAEEHQKFKAAMYKQSEDTISNMDDSLEFYKKLSDDTNKRLDDILKKNNELIASNESLEKEVKQLKVTVDDLTVRLSKYEKVNSQNKKRIYRKNNKNNNLNKGE